MFRRLWFTLLLDSLLINLAFAFSYYARYELELFRPVNDAFQAPYSDYLSFQASYTLLLLLFLYLDGLYAPRRGGSWFESAYHIANATTTAVVILIAVTFIIQPLVYSRLLLVETAVVTIFLLSGYRLAERVAAARLRRRGLGVSRVIIVGAGESGRAVMRHMVALPELGYQVVGFVDDDPGKGDLGRFKALGGLDQLGALIRSERADEAIITLPWTYHYKIMQVVRTCQALGVRARVVPDLFQLSLSRVDFDDVGGIPLIGLREPSLSAVGQWAKRGLDMVLAVLGVLVAAPLAGLIMLAIRLETPGPVIFRQTRIGKDGQPFLIYKFRSMRATAEAEKETLLNLNEADGPLFKIRADPRITRVGRFLRRTSLDELPNLINVLRGEMSLVGPRPGLPEEVAQYQAWHRQRLEVPPGLTGLWQVSGRSDLAFDEMCLLDIYYIENWSLSLDLIVLLRTIPHVLLGEGAY